MGRRDHWPVGNEPQEDGPRHQDGVRRLEEEGRPQEPRRLLDRQLLQINTLSHT